MVLALNLARHNHQFEKDGIDAGVPTPLWNMHFTAPSQKTSIGRFYAHAMRWGQETLNEMIDAACKKDVPDEQDINILSAICEEDAPRQFFPSDGCINSWVTKTHWKGRYRHIQVEIFASPEGVRTCHVQEIPTDPFQRFDMMMRSFQSRDGSGSLRAERVAARKLRKMLSKEQLKQFTLTDMFCEIGRSGVRYYLRKNRPTIAMRDNNVLCAMCTHPAGYYTGTWTGALPPSDEIIAHLGMIRADEHYFWRKSNQIAIGETNSGI